MTDGDEDDALDGWEFPAEESAVESAVESAEETADEPDGEQATGDQLHNHGNGAEEGGEDGGNVAGDLAQSDPVVPESIDPENALFVLIGALFVIGFLALAIYGL